MTGSLVEFLISESVFGSSLACTLRVFLCMAVLSGVIMRDLNGVDEAVVDLHLKIYLEAGSERELDLNCLVFVYVV